MPSMSTSNHGSAGSRPCEAGARSSAYCSAAVRDVRRRRPRRPPRAPGRGRAGAPSACPPRPGRRCAPGRPRATKRSSPHQSSTPSQSTCAARGARRPRACTLREIEPPVSTTTGTRPSFCTSRSTSTSSSATTSATCSASGEPPHPNGVVAGSPVGVDRGRVVGHDPVLRRPRHWLVFLAVVFLAVVFLAGFLARSSSAAFFLAGLAQLGEPPRTGGVHVVGVEPAQLLGEQVGDAAPPQGDGAVRLAGHGQGREPCRRAARSGSRRRFMVEHHLGDPGTRRRSGGARVP